LSGSDHPSGPRVLSFGTNVTRASPNVPLIVSAVLTDPDGVDDLVGGTLLAPGTDATYGAFSADAQEGAYQISLAWSAIDDVAPIDTTLAAPTTARAFVARFFDQAGHAVEESVEVALGCDDPEHWARAGQCAPLLWSSSCHNDNCWVTVGHNGTTGDEGCGAIGEACLSCDDGHTCRDPLEGYSVCTCTDA
jgi:hypothetical protein